MKKLLSYLIIGFFSIFSHIGYADNDDIYQNPYSNIGQNSQVGFREGLNAVIENVTGFRGTSGNESLADYIMDIVGYVLTFIFIVTVIIFIWAGATVLVSAGDEGKVEKAKKIMIYCVFGVIIIFLAYPIAKFILSLFIEGYR